jgi:glycine cleavage system H lipoate-binding protein
MEGIRFVDIYATKGIEYLIVIGFLAAFVLFVRYLSRPRPAAKVAAQDDYTQFRIPDGLFYHQGHGWLRPEPGSIGVVGLDDFARKLVGKVDSVELPPVGARLEQGAPGWKLVVDSVPVSMLSPVNGEVVEVNKEVLRSPALLRTDPYGKGWLLKVKDSRIAADTHNLLSGKMARAWMENALAKLHPVEHELGTVMQDGGTPVEGIARMLGGEHWAEVAEEHLQTREGAGTKQASASRA